MSKKPLIFHSEAQVKRAVYDYLDAKKYIYIPIQNSGTWNPKGFRQTFKGTRGAPDLMLFIPGEKAESKNLKINLRGRWICVELKSTTGKQSKHQKEFQHHLEIKGGEYYIVRGINDLEGVLGLR
jgi:hypothetical protein